MRKQRGRVLKKENNTCLVFTHGGEFKRVSFPEDVRVGEEVLFPQSTPTLRGVLLILTISLYSFYFGWLFRVS
jgi:hypothetical protein